MTDKKHTIHETSYFADLKPVELSPDEIGKKFGEEVDVLAEDGPGNRSLLEKYGKAGVIERFRAICEAHSNGEKMEGLHKRYGISHATFHRILLYSRPMRDLFWDACQMYCQFLWQEMLTIIDNTSQDTAGNDRFGNPMENREWIRRSEARCSVRKDYILRYMPYIRLKRSTDNLTDATKDLLKAVLDGDIDLERGQKVMGLIQAQQRYVIDNELVKRVDDLEKKSRR